MKINRISASGFLAVKSIEVDVRSPIVLFCGSNEAGKSSLRDGIYQAFMGENPRVKLKKNYKFLVHNKEVAGYTYIDYDGNQKAAITIPNGTHELTGQLHSALPYVLNPALFASIAPDERGKLLFNLGNLRSDGAEVKQKLLDRGCDAAKVDEIMPFLRSSFENAYKQVTENVKEARTNWKATTGEVYGDKKAEGWKAPVPVIDITAKGKAEAELSRIDTEIEEANKNLGAMQAVLNGANQRAGEIARLKELSEKESRIRKKLDHDRHQVEEWQTKIEETKKLALGSRPGAVACKCPECDAELIFADNELIARAGDMHGNEDAAASLGKYENALAMFKNSVASGERDLAAATAAREQLALMKDDQEPPKQEDIDALKNKVSTLKSGLQQALSDLETINKNIRLASEAEAKTQKAAEHHAAVQAWDKIASALTPDGIPGEMLLHAALDPINARLAESSAATGWKPVIINPDMSISYEGRPHELSSVSAKWRANVMIAEAISYVAGIKFLMADEFDLLDLPSRGACMKWLVGLARNGEIDSVLLFGTLKEKPAKLPADVEAHWIQSGLLEEQELEAVA